jgi:hypothetical protein
MTRDEIIKMAREADIDPYDMCEDPRIATNNLIRFAALVAAAEREACAKECEEIDANPHVALHHAVVCAAAIRRRGEP